MADFLQTLTFLDAYNTKTSRSYHITAADFAAARLIATNNLTTIQAIVLGAVIKETLAEQNFIGGVPGAGANVDTGATFTWDMGSGKTASTNLPMPVPAIINVDRSINLADANVLAWTANYTDGDILVSDGEVVQSVIHGELDK